MDTLVSSAIAPGSLPAPNDRVARFYDRAHWLYPLIDGFCAAGRRRLIAEINRQPSGRLLEIGVGPGGHLPLYGGHAVTAVDCSAAMVALCRQVAPKVDVRRMDGEALALADASFDYVVLCHVLSVTTRPERMLAEALRVLRPGGRIFVLNHETPANGWRHLDRWLEPLARRLEFRSWFRLAEVAGVERLRVRRLENVVGCGGLMRAHVLERK